MEQTGGEGPPQPTRLRKNYVGTLERRWSAQVAQQKNIYTGCSKRPFSKAAASEEARRTFQYVEPLSDARTPLSDFFSILLDPCALVQLPPRIRSLLRGLNALHDSSLPSFPLQCSVTYNAGPF